MVFDESKSTFGTFEDRAIWLIGQLLADFKQMGVLDAAAVAGNFGQESGIQMIQEIGATPPNGGFGLAQWTGPRRTQFEDYCRRAKRDPNAMSSGYAFTFVELKGDFAHALDKTVAAVGLAAKTQAFEEYYEMAGIVNEADRLAYAERAQKAWEGHSIPVPTTTPPPTTGQPGASPMPSFLDNIRGALDNADNKLDTIVDSIDKAKSIPFVGSLISPYVTYVDEFRVLIDTIRKQVDAADPPAPATPPKA